MRTEEAIKEKLKQSEKDVLKNTNNGRIVDATFGYGYSQALEWVLESGDKDQQAKTIIKEIFAICKNCPDTTIECSGCCPKKHKKLKDILEVIESENKDDTSK